MGSAEPNGVEVGVEAQVDADLAVLFVHGIGQQLQGETLVKFADPISQWFARWISRGRYTEAKPSAPGMDSVRLGRTELSGSEPAHTELVIAATNELPFANGQRWILAESWWAQAFEAPKARALLLWMLLILPYLSIIQFYAQLARALRSPSRRGLAGAVGWVGRVVFCVLIYLCALPVAAVAALAIVLVLTALLLPIPQLSDSAKKVALILSNTIGDCYVLVSSATQFDAMVSRVVDDLQWASKQGKSLAVVAHSQGAAVAYQALSTHTPHNTRVFVTVGEAIKKLHLIQGLQTFGEPRRALGWPGFRVFLRPRELRRRAVWRAVGRAIRRWFKLRSLRFTIGWLGLLGTYGLLYSAPQIVIALLRGSHMRTIHRNHGALFTLFGASMAAVLGVLLCCFVFWREDLRDNVDDLYTEADGEKTPVRWANFYASADPVSNGPLLEPSAENHVRFEREVWNFASVIRDHTTYTSSQDDFLGCVIAQLAHASGNDFGPMLRNRLIRARWRGWWRVWWLSLTRFVAAAAAIASLVSVGGNLPKIGSRVIGWHWWHPLRPIGHSLIVATKKLILVGHPSNDQVVGGMTVLAVIVGGYLLLALFWSYWQRQDIKRFYRRADKDSDPLGGRELWLYITVLLAELAVTVTTGVSGDYAVTWNWCTQHWPWTLLIIAALLRLPVLLTWLTRPSLRSLETWLMRELPRRPDPPPLPESEPLDAGGRAPVTV